MPDVAFAWAKLHDDRALPLSDHGTDVACVLDALLRGGWDRRIAHAAGRPINAPERAALLTAAYLHDLGKANAGFWARLHPGATRVGHLRPVVSGHAGLSEILEPLVRSCGEDLLLAMLAHHGRPVVPDDRDARHWNPSERYDPLEQLGKLLERARLFFPDGWSEGAGALPPRAISLYAGLLTLADWIGSSAERFAIDGLTGEARRQRSRAIANEAVRRLGLTEDIELRDRAGVSFEQAFGFEPRGLQQALGSPGDSLVVLEAETGSGKTEAALWRFLNLFAAGEVDGLYFALPTRTSAVQMQNRVQRCMDRVFGAGVVPVTLAVPGYMRAGDAEGQRLTGWEVLWPDDPDDATRDARWSAEAAKQYLSARVAVGTVDQVLLSGLKVRHAHLRAACLSRSLLVVDEVHASDTYMTEILGRVLENHLGAGGHALLLSATLGSGARASLMSRRNAQLPPLNEAEGLSYPAVHGLAAPALGPGKEKLVEVGIVPAIDEPAALATLALDAARQGARVLVIRNTVAGAVEVQEALEAEGGPLWTVKGDPALHHGRFAAEDRRVLDRGIEDAFGKKSSKGGIVAVGTQTVEISLDLDADLMITDLAPADVLLQRIGRLHRHADRARAVGFERARLLVAVPIDRDLTAYIGRVRRRHGLGPSGDGMGGVYANLPALEATWAELERRGVLCLPSDNRAIVERATHPEALDAIVQAKGWERFWSKYTGAQIGERQVARSELLDLGIPFRSLDPFPEAGEAAATRLGARDHLLRLPDGTPGAFGQVTSLRLPAWMAGSLPMEVQPEIEPEKAGFRMDLRCAAGEMHRFVYDRLGLRTRPETECKPRRS